MLIRPKPTPLDYMVAALSPALIMALVGSLCYFLIDVRYRGEMDGPLCWVMFWFILGIVLISRISIEHGPERAIVFGLGLGAALWLYTLQNSPAYLLSLILMALVWYCASVLVWDCTLVDDDLDASGQGLLQAPLKPQKAQANPPQTDIAKQKKAQFSIKPKRKPSTNPGRSVIYFSLAALPIFGIGQLIIPSTGDGRKIGFVLMAIYMTAALGLFVTTSFLGLRRYLRQRSLVMPPSIAFAWVKFGGFLTLFIIIAAMFIPRPGAGEAWITLRHQFDHRIHQISEMATPPDRRDELLPPQTDDSPTSSSAAEVNNSGTENQAVNSQSADKISQQANASASPNSNSLATAKTYTHLRRGVLIAFALFLLWQLIRLRHILMELIRSLIEAIKRSLLYSMPKPVRPAGPSYEDQRRRSLADFKNPFFADAKHSRPPDEIILYTFEALHAWARENGIEEHPEQTPREFCNSIMAQLPDQVEALRQLAFLHAHVAYGHALPEQCDLEPLKDLWQTITWTK